MRELTGPKVLAIAVASFGLIIAVNFYMAFQAISTFPGLEVENSYVASQSFDQDRKAQQALGWTVTPRYDAVAQQMHLSFVDAAGAPVTLGDLSVLIGRSTEAADDMRPVFRHIQGQYVAQIELGMGKWMLHLTAHSTGGVRFQQRLGIWVKG
jgi:nitrogen fixation protein FixH